MTDNFSLLLIDPDAVRRQEVKDVLSGLPFVVAAEAHYGVEGVRLAVELQPDVVLVRIEAPLAPGLHMLSAVQDNAPHSTPVVLTSRDDAVTARRLMLAGARALIVTPPARDVLRRTLTEARTRHLATLQRLDHPDEFRPSVGGCVITIVGAKGGVGKTSLAVNLSIALAARTAAAVALVDTDLVYGDVALHMGLTRVWESGHPAPHAGDTADSDLSAQLIEHPSGVSVLARWPSPAGALPAPDTVQRGLRELARRFDFVVTDTPEGFSEYTMAALEASSMVILLTSSEVSSVKDARVLRDSLRQHDLDTDRLKLVVNRATQANSVTDDEISRAMGEPIFWSFPYDSKASDATQTGEPLIIAHPRSTFAQGVDVMATLLGAVEVEESRSWLGRLFLGQRPGRY